MELEKRLVPTKNVDKTYCRQRTWTKTGNKRLDKYLVGTNGGVDAEDEHHQPSSLLFCSEHLAIIDLVVYK
jgi:hypothetical protein